MATTIEWTDETWNPLTGCTKISPGCAHCYAERLAGRLKLMGNPNYAAGFALTLHPHELDKPLRWKSPRHVFVNSMSDLFHVDVSLEFIRRVFETMTRATQHTFQILTKRADRLAELAPQLPWPDNVWQGVTVESAAYTSRIDRLRQTPARTKFLSVEPLLGPIPDLDLTGIDWVILGGESGPGYRPVQAEWLRGVRDACARQGVALFFKQWGGTNKKKTGRELDGRTHDDRPPPVGQRLSLPVVPA